MRLRKHTAKISSIMSKVDKMGLNTIEPNSLYNRTFDAINRTYGKEEGYHLVFTTLDYKQLFKTYTTKSGLTIDDDTLEVEYYNAEGFHNTEYMFYHLEELFETCKPIIMVADLHQYACQTDADDVQHMDSHTVCYLFMPMDDGYYEMLYYNSHGSYVKDSAVGYWMYISRRRSKLIELPCGVDFYVNRSIVKSFNKKARWYESKWRIGYNESAYYNYVGVNLQQGDNYGLCYAFPFLIFRKLVLNTRLDNHSKYGLPDLKTLLALRQHKTIMMVIMAEYSKKLQTLLTDIFVEREFTTDYDNIIDTYEDMLDSVFKRSCAYILKLAIQDYLLIIELPDIKEKLTDYIDAEEK